MRKELCARCKLHQRSLVDHADAVGDEAYHAQVVRNEQVGQMMLLFQFVEQIDDLRSD